MKYPSKKQWLIIAAVYVLGVLAFTGLGVGLMHYMNSSKLPYHADSARFKILVACKVNMVAVGVALAVFFSLALLALAQIRRIPRLAVVGLGLVFAFCLWIYASHHSRPGIQVVQTGQVSAPSTDVLRSPEGALVCRVRPTIAHRLRSMLGGDSKDNVLRECAYFAAEQCIKSRLVPEGVRVRGYSADTCWYTRKLTVSIQHFRGWRDDLWREDSYEGVMRDGPNFRVNIMLEPVPYRHDARGMSYYVTVSEEKPWVYSLQSIALRR